MIVIAIDTCDSRGSVALLRDGRSLGSARHESSEDYSVWLLPAVDSVLRQSGNGMAEVDAYAVMSGPGSFTGVRVGLTTVKAWAEVYGKPIVALSRLEAIASRALHGTAYVAAFADANRGYVYGAVYRRSEAGLTALGDEMVFAPEKFVAAAADLAAGERISWASTDADAVLADAAWEGRKKLNEQIEQVSPFLAETLARLAVGRLAVGQSTDALALDANYVRRPDAEMFWKDTKAHGR